ncbi:MAG: hypothetical protein QOJ29_3680 [Thermoleophilaceae bacterium]|jgi:multidrug efflux pump subunit AcrA (membrane-fusion protein)|nr:hypothetical protein [Thermoleophilaceae bacterium]
MSMADHYRQQAAQVSVWHQRERKRADELDAALASERDARAEAERQRDEAREALYECAKISGADVSDGAPTWPPIEQWAVEEVAQLRRDCDEDTPSDAEARLSAAEADRDQAKEAAQRLREALKRIGMQHHATLTGSKLHDPERLSMAECPAKTCQAVRAALAPPEAPSQAADPPDR